MKHFLFLLILPMVIFTGCRKPSSYEISLYPDEVLNRGDKVFLEGEPVAEVQEIYLVGEDQPVARVQLLDRRFENKFVQGIQRKPQRGEIHLVKTSTVSPDDAESLIAGSRIGIRSNPVPPSLWPPNQNTLILSAIIIVGIILIFLVFNRILRIALATIALLLSASTAWITYPIIVPYTQQVMAYLQDSSDTLAPQSSDDAEMNDDAIEKVFETLSIPLRKEHINPVYVSFGTVMVLSFILYSFIIGGARRKLLKDE